MTEREREHLESLAALCAAGAASREEHRELDELVATHPEAAAEARAFADAAALLAEDLPERAPPPHALADIRRTLRETHPLTPRPRRARLMTAVAAVAAAAAIAFAWLWQRERGVTAELREEMTRELSAARDEMRSAVARAETAESELDAMRRRFGVAASPHLRLASIAAEEAPGHAKILVDPEGRRWLVMAHALPPAPPGKDYQMWIIPKGEGAAPMPAGLLAPGPGGAMEVEVAVPADVDPGFAAISLEKAGGVQAPTDVQMLGPI